MRQCLRAQSLGEFKIRKLFCSFWIVPGGRSRKQLFQLRDGDLLRGVCSEGRERQGERGNAEHDDACEAEAISNDVQDGDLPSRGHEEFYRARATARSGGMCHTPSLRKRERRNV